MKRNAFLSLFFCLFVLLNYAQVTKPIGINISGVADYSTELVFTDAFKQSRSWITSNADGSGAWDTGVTVPLNANGYPLQIPYNDGVNPPQIVKTLMLWDIGSAVPQGMYRLKVTGNGQVRLSNGASGTFNCPVDTFVNVTGGVIFEILQSNVSNPISEINFIYPNYTSTYQTKSFTDEFVNFLNDFQVIRFMDFTSTNNSSVVNWSDRTLKSNYSQAKTTGAAWEYVIDIANLTQKDIWINIPHKANDNYIQQLAALLQNTLNPNSKVYLEFSNEVWNSGFSQQADCATMAQNLGYTGQSWERAWKYTAKRSADIFHIFQNVFTNDQRLIKIIPSQAANSWLSNQLVTYFNDPLYNPNQVTANAIAIAPYFGNSVADDIANGGTANSVTIPQIIQQAQTALTNDTYQWILSNKTVAANNNLQLICYEAGQHLTATGNNVNNTTLTSKLIATNHDPAFQSLYCNYFDYWYNNVGTLMCHFSSHGTYSKWGSWGVKENFQDVNNPKYLAMKNCVFNANVLATADLELEDKELVIYPNPTNDWIEIKSNSSLADNFEYNLFDLTGRNILSGKSNFNEPISVQGLMKSTYTLELKYDNQTKVKKLLKI